MKPIVKNADYLIGKDTLDFPQKVEIHVSRFGDNRRRGGQPRFEFPYAYKVYINTSEPVSSQNREEIEHVIRYGGAYDLILTTDVEILQQLSNARFFPYGTTWLNRGKIDHPDSIGEYGEEIDELHSSKEFSVSFLGTSHPPRYAIGSIPAPEGYALRHELWKRQDEITIPKVFYNSTRSPFSDSIEMLPDDDKKHLFRSQFSIAIESTEVTNYFSEKLIDCLITKTVPIYWGVPNLIEFFDERGIIVVNSVYELVKKVNKLTPETYKKMLKYVEKNYEIAKNLYATSFSSRVQKVIDEELSTTLTQNH